MRCRTRAIGIIVASALFGLGSPARSADQGGNAAAGPSAEQLIQLARKALPENLAAAWFSADTMLKMMPITQGGSTVTMNAPGQQSTIDASNVAQFTKTFKERRDIYGAEIKRRGYVSFAGRYAIDIAKSCFATNTSAYLLNRTTDRKGDEAFKLADTVEIRQNEFRLELIDRLQDTRSGEITDFSFKGAGVESTFVLEDRVSPDIMYVGHKAGRRILLRPWVEVIQGSYSPYPSWIPTPDARALASCTITLDAR